VTPRRVPWGAGASLALCAWMGATTPTLACSRHERSEELAGPKSYHAVGVIKSFGPGRTFVNIAHEDIPGYMKAMVMAFEPQRPGELDGLSQNDRVEFDFVETEDARRVLTRIAKR
jgi:Cu(I)/Ag(I) efflux system periplasmic protein CusF